MITHSPACVLRLLVVCGLDLYHGSFEVDKARALQAPEMIWGHDGTIKEEEGDIIQKKLSETVEAKSNPKEKVRNLQGNNLRQLRDQASI